MNYGDIRLSPNHGGAGAMTLGIIIHGTRGGASYGVGYEAALNSVRQPELSGVGAPSVKFPRRAHRRFALYLPYLVIVPAARYDDRDKSQAE